MSNIILTSPTFNTDILYVINPISNEITQYIHKINNDMYSVFVNKTNENDELFHLKFDIDSTYESITYKAGVYRYNNSIIIGEELAFPYNFLKTGEIIENNYQYLVYSNYKRYILYYKSVITDLLLNNR